MRWQDAAFEQEHLIHSLNGYFGQLCDGYEETAFGLAQNPILRRVHAEMLARADPMYVSGDAMTLWEHARESFELEPIQRSDLVAPCGFALLPWGTTVSDRTGMDVSFRAIAWMPVANDNTGVWNDDVPGAAVWVSLLSHFTDADDWLSEDSPEMQAARTNGWRWGILHAAAFEFEIPVWERFGTQAEAGVVERLFRYVQSFWRLSAQLVPVREQLHRQARKQRIRRHLSEDVTVIHLRRPRAKLPDGHEAREVEWDHQWVVRGHWRKQPYGDRKNPSYRQVWIAPYVKGPDDKPLKITQRAFEWTR